MPVFLERPPENATEWEVEFKKAMTVAKENAYRLIQWADWWTRTKEIHAKRRSPAPPN